MWLTCVVVALMCKGGPLMAGAGGQDGRSNLSDVDYKSDTPARVVT